MTRATAKPKAEGQWVIEARMGDRVPRGPR